MSGAIEHDTKHHVEHKVTFCRICEPLCGMIATVEDGRITTLRPDKEHPLSKGFACQKGIAFTEVHNDPDRVTTPLRRTATGFEPVSWDDALTDITNRLAEILRREGSGAIGCYMGNPAAFSYSHLMWLMMFIKGIGRDSHFFSASTQDTSSRLMASQLLYGSPNAVPIPDLARIDLLVVMGANPVVSHGSFLSAPRIRERFAEIVNRGGRVVVVDPRKTETAAQFEWLGIVPDSDPALLLSLLQVMFDEGLVDRDRLSRQADGLDRLEKLCRPFTPEATEALTGLGTDTVRALARDLVRTRRAAIYGRVGTCIGRYATLTNYLMDVVNLVAGNLDVAGGSVFTGLEMPGQKWSNLIVGAVLRRAYRRKRSRIGGFRSLIGSEPAALMAKEITTPGERQIKAMIVSAGNPVLSVPNGAELEAAFGELELSVALDLYVTETTGRCDYVLPVTTMYERDDFPFTFQPFQATLFRQATDAVVAPTGQAWPEWQIFDAMMARLTRYSPVFAAIHALRALLRRFGVTLSPRLMMDAIVRMSQGGDLFGLRRGGLTLGRLTRDHPHGVVLAEELATDQLDTVVAYSGRRIRLHHSDIESEVARLQAARRPDGFPLLMIGMRQPRSENSWMHNSPLLMRGHRHQGFIHVDDAAELGIDDGDTATVTSPYGQIAIPLARTKDIMRGVIAIPHGWGHNGSGMWKLANRAGGANVNQLMSSDPTEVESVSGMSWLTGIPVRVGPSS